MSGESNSKNKFDIYSVLLIIAFVALLFGTVFAYLETSDYGTNKTKGAPSVSVVQPLDRLVVDQRCFSDLDVVRSHSPRGQSFKNVF